MNNKGGITVFLCMLISVIMVLGISVIKIIDIRAAKAKAVICANTSLSSVKAMYNKYIFEHYHILLFDKNCDEKGEAYLEEYIKSLMEMNLGDEIKVRDVIGVKYNFITDNGYSELKKQIEEYMIYAGIEYGIEQITDATGGKDGTIDENILMELDNASEEIEEDEGVSDDKDDDGPAENQAWTDNVVSDPREFVKDIFDDAVLYYVLPEGMTPSAVHQNIYDTPSFWSGEQGKFNFNNKKINTDFDDMSSFKEDLTYRDSWLDSLKDTGASIFYARNVFNCATNTEINDQTVFEYELEYLVAGRNSDVRNLSKTVNEIIALRFPVNFVYLLSDAYRTARVMSISYPISLLSPISEKVIRYLIAGCWSYIESIAEVRQLLRGNRISFIKTTDNWITDIENPIASICNYAGKDDSGLCYEDYLMILLATNMDKTYIRMLDLMEINAQLEDDKFQIESSVTALYMDFLLRYGDYDCSVRVGSGY